MGRPGGPWPWPWSWPWPWPWPWSWSWPWGGSFSTNRAEAHGQLVLSPLRLPEQLKSSR